MVHRRPSLPAGHGELLVRPDYADWAAVATANQQRAGEWDFTVADLPAQELRALARKEFVQSAAVFSARLGVPVAAPKDEAAFIVATGHQTEIYHPGIWVKDFLLQRFSEEHDATGVDVMVDSDGFASVGIEAPCLGPEIRRCRQTLAVGTQGGWFASTPVPTGAEIETFIEAGLKMVQTLPAPAVHRHFATFGEHLRSAASDARNLAELLTFARRRYEAEAGTDYLELPVTTLAGSDSYTAFLAHLALDARRFAEAYNAELADFRAVTGTRSNAQPFPDLDVRGDSVELPAWALAGGMRETIVVTDRDDVVEMTVGGGRTVRLPRDAAAAARALRTSGCVFAPKALLLTMYLRLWCCDLFLHGVGGGRYDRVTDGVVRRYFGIEPPEFAVASLTMYLPLGSRIVTDEEIAAAKDRLNRLAHNPDSLLSEVDFDDEAERVKATALAAEKLELVCLIAAPDAEKKALGARIRQVNSELGEVLAPLRQGFEADLATLVAQRQASDVLTDRTYPFCFWSPLEVADKVR